MNKILQNKKFQTGLLLSLTIVVLYFLLKDNFLEVMTELFKMNIGWVLVTIILILGFWMFKAIGNYIIIKQVKPDFKIIDSLKINLIVQFFNSITPFSAGGHPAQVYLLKKHDISLSNGTNITIQNFIVYQIAVVIIQIFSIIMAFKTNIFGNNYLMKLLVIGGLGLDFFIILILFILAFSKKTKYILIKIGITILTKFKLVKNKEKKLEEWNEKIITFHTGAVELMKNKKDFYKSIVCNFIGLIAFYLTPLTLLYATGDYTSLLPIESIFTISCIVMAADLVPTPGQLGGLEYGFSVLFGNYIGGYILPTVLIAWRFLSYYLTIIIGSITLNIRKEVTTD